MMDVNATLAPVLAHGGLSLFSVGPDLLIKGTAGPAVAGAAEGVHVFDAFDALIGSEQEIQALQTGLSDHPHLLRNIATTEGDPPRLIYRHITVYAAGNGSLTIATQDATEDALLAQQLVQRHNELDLTRRELEKARDAALAANRAKSAFLANISHELRTPLNVVIGNAQIITQAKAAPLPPDELGAYADDIVTSGEFLLEMINDLIDLSRAETGNLRLVEDWCDIGRLAMQSRRFAERLPGGRDRRIVLSAPDALPLVWADPRRLKQIFLNLLSNAVKFTPPGGRILVQVSARPDSLRIEVADDGPGLSADDLTIALEPFGQLASAQRHKGTGLGLPIVRTLARLHDSELEIETAPGHGFCARIDLPASRIEGIRRTG